MAIGVITLLMAFGAGAFPQGSQGRVLKETAKLAVLCEVAAQNAKASNRWVYLFLHEDAATEQVHVVMVSDRDGADAFAGTTEMNSTDQTLQILGRTEQLSGVKLDPANGLFTDLTLDHEGREFTKSLRFSPTGRVDADPNNFVTLIRIGVNWTHDAESTQPVVLELASLTAMTRISQP